MVIKLHGKFHEPIRFEKQKMLVNLVHTRNLEMKLAKLKAIAKGTNVLKRVPHARN